MENEWSEILSRIEQDHGKHKAQQVSDLIHDGIISDIDGVHQWVDEGYIWSTTTLK